MEAKTPSDQFYDKLGAEYDDFIDRLRNRSADEILNAAYQKVCYDEIVSAFEGGDFTDRDYEALNAQEDLISSLYYAWLDTDKTVKKKQKQRRISEHSARAGNATNTNVQPQTAAAIADTPKQADLPIIVQPDTNEREEVRREQPLNRNDLQPHNPHRVPQKGPPIKPKPPPVISCDNEQPTPQAEKPTDTPRSALKHDDGGKLKFERDGEPAPVSQRRQKPPQRYQPEIAEQSDNAADSLPATDKPDDTPKQSKLSDAPPSALRHDAPDTLHLEPQGDEVRPSGRKPKQRPVSPQSAESVADGNQPVAPVTAPPIIAPKADTAEAAADRAKPVRASDTAATADAPGHSKTDTDSPLHSESSGAPLHTGNAETPLKPNKPRKLQFTEDETPPIPSRGEVKQARTKGNSAT